LAETQVVEMKKDVDTLARVVGSDELFGVRVVAKLLNQQEKKFVAYLQQRRWAYRQVGTSHLLCYADKHLAGYCRNVGTPYPKSDGTMGIRDTLKFYPKGIFKLAAELNVEITQADLFGLRGDA
jgi:phage antirepressor YoqD-like protein